MMPRIVGKNIAVAIPDRVARAQSSGNGARFVQKHTANANQAALVMISAAIST
ncbi:hypothetical protein GCM10009735_80480 [Actinomadura chokoriensis]